MDVPGDAVLEAGARMGRFVVVRSLGEGGMGKVYEARDPELGRSVALKVLHGKNPVLAMRLLREAQVLAQLQHPNVVTVHALDLHDDQVFIAMELVAGETLDKHIARTKPDWRGRVALFVQAGRGLVAAHAKAIVHRDVKPSNMFVDESGRVRVGDFGLARQIGDESKDQRPGDPAPAVDPTSLLTTDAADPSRAKTESPHGRKLAGSSLTHAGAVLGTPYFMSPEQHLGRRATPASDQFSFCVALWLALFDQHPFAIDEQLGAAVIDGRRREHTSKRKVPRWLERALDRGLEVDPQKRHPSMAALLAILDSDPARRRRLALAGTAALVVVGGVVALGFARRSAATDPCPAPDDQVAATWNEPRRTAIRAHLATIDPVQGGSRFEVALRTVDPFVQSWRDTHVGACRATRVRGEQSDTLLDARMRCLRHRLSELDASVGLLGTAADPLALDRAVGGLVKLTPVASCSDAGSLARDVAAPLAPGARAAADELMQRIQRLDVNQRARRLTDLSAQAAEAVADARKLGHSPTLSAALLTLARVELTSQHSEAAEAALRELTQVAARAHDDRSEAFAWTGLVSLVGTDRGKPVEALPLVPAASAAIVRAGEPIDLRVDLLYAEAEVLSVAAKGPEALAKLGEARKMLEAAGASDASSPLAPRLNDIWQETGTAHARSGDFDDAEAAYRKSIELSRALYGPDSLDESFALSNLAESLKDAGKLDRALPASLEAVRITELRTGESVRTASNLTTLGTIYGYQKQWEKALATSERVLRILRAKLPADDPQLVGPLLNYAWHLGGLGRYDEEIKAYDEIIALCAKIGVAPMNLGYAHWNRAETLATKRARCTDAVADYQQATSIIENNAGKTSMHLVTPLLGHGRCLVLTKRPAEALVPLERAAKLEVTGINAAAGHGVKAWLGRALIETGRDRTRGLKLAREARSALAAMTGDPAAADVLRDLEPWLKRMKLQ